MTRASSNDLDFLTTRLHARRSRMAEGKRLEELCQVRNLPELGGVIFSGTELTRAADFQRRLVQDLVQELSACLKHLETEEQDFIAWLLARFQVENAKILLRGFLNSIVLETLQPRLVALPSGWELDATALLAAKSLEAFACLLPSGSPRHRLRALLAQLREPQPFLLEAALDAGYFRELLSRNNRLPSGELEIVKPLVLQEANLFQLMLVLRGRFLLGLQAESLLPLRVSEGGDHAAWFHSLVSAPDLPSAVKCGVGIVLDELPAGRSAGTDPAAMEVAAVETLAWQRYLHLANSAFRASHNGVGAVAGYFGVRRMEIANLITLSEGLRLGVEARETQARLLPRTNLEVAHV